MDYVIDFEFDGYKGKLISMALVREDLVSMYVGFKDTVAGITDEWVANNVIPVLDSAPIPIRWRTNKEVQEDLEKFFKGDNHINIITDWPDDVSYFSQLLLTGPGTMINIPGIKFEVRRIDAYPTRLKDAVQHNALWDAQALMYKITHPNPPPQYLLIRILNGKRYYYAEYTTKQKSGSSLGTWTRKRNSSAVVHFDSYQDAAEKVNSFGTLVNNPSTSQVGQLSGLSYRNQAHTYYGRSYLAMKVAKWLFGVNPPNKLDSSIKLQIVEDGGKEVWGQSAQLNLNAHEPMTKKTRVLKGNE